MHILAVELQADEAAAGELQDHHLYAIVCDVLYYVIICVYIYIYIHICICMYNMVYFIIVCYIILY